jgi:signal transduction histidine kinase
VGKNSAVRTEYEIYTDFVHHCLKVICSIFPELNDEGDVIEIIGSCVNISQQKWGEKLQATQASRARESKRSLENFIDTTSHEMRNPLSAIVQCADSIISIHKAFEKSTDYQNAYQTILETTIDAAETIVQCSKHMKTIVDDVLTMSKLDSGLFAMTPIDVQVDSVARDAVKMFEGEAKAAGVDLKFHLEESCTFKNVSLDPTRVLQILIVRFRYLRHYASAYSIEPHYQCHQIHPFGRGTSHLRQSRPSP